MFLFINFMDLIFIFMKKLLYILPVYYYYLFYKQCFFNVPIRKKNKILFFLKKHVGIKYKILSDIICIDFLTYLYRFELIYNLLSILYNHRIFMKVRLPEGKRILTILKIYINSNWMEREVFEMFGIIFYKHPDLRRLLSDFFFEGYPLKKDFSITGVREICFSIKSTEYQNINFQQKNRFLLYEHVF
jgi:NADH-quinone oxidoreductase subunit C